MICFINVSYLKSLLNTALRADIEKVARLLDSQVFPSAKSFIRLMRYSLCNTGILVSEYSEDLLMENELAVIHIFPSSS